MNILHITAYRFVKLSNLGALSEQLLHECQVLDLKGTILLAEEGINLNLAGPAPAIQQFQALLPQYHQFTNLTFKVSFAEHVPFNYLRVKIKPEIVTMGRPEIKPTELTAPELSPLLLKQWLDEGKDLTLLDTRNGYEFNLGHFKGAVHLNIRHFRQFPEASLSFLNMHKNHPVIMYCTGGIRCEKASAWAIQQGSTEIYQLQGGILNYFQQCGSVHYEGECFVFDQRLGVDAACQPVAVNLCKHCQSILQLDSEDEYCSLCDRVVAIAF